MFILLLLRQEEGINMLNEQRVVLMTRLAMHEKREGKENTEIGTYFRSDYISLHLIGSVICATVSFLLGLGLYVLYDSEAFVNGIYSTDIAALAGKILMYYLIFLAVYFVISYICFAVRYRKARSRLKVYFCNLRRLQLLYKKERKEKK